MDLALFGLWCLFALGNCGFVLGVALSPAIRARAGGLHVDNGAVVQGTYRASTEAAGSNVVPEAQPAYARPPDHVNVPVPVPAQRQNSPQADSTDQEVQLKDEIAALQYELVIKAVRSGEPLTRDEIADHLSQSHNPTFKRGADQLADTTFRDLISRGIIDETGIVRIQELADDELEEHRLRDRPQGMPG
jgi:hypothetical protein